MLHEHRNTMHCPLIFYHRKKKKKFQKNFRGSEKSHTLFPVILHRDSYFLKIYPSAKKINCIYKEGVTF